MVLGLQSCVGTTPGREMARAVDRAIHVGFLISGSLRVLGGIVMCDETALYAGLRNFFSTRDSECP